MRKRINLSLYEIPLYTFGFFPIIPNRLKGFCVIFLFLISLYSYLIFKNTIYPKKKVLEFSSIYIILIISLINTSNFINIDKLLSTRLGLLIVPISFGFFYGVKKEINFNFLLKYTNLLLLITTFFSLWILHFLNQLGVFSNKMSMYDAMAYITNEMWLINQHPIYTSIFISISILLLVYCWLILKNRRFILITLPFLLVNLFTLFILERKGVLISFIISLVILIMKLLNKKTYKRFFIISIFTSAIFFVCHSHRFKEIFTVENYSSSLKYNSTSLRFGIYNCALSKISESPIFGFGLGDVQLELNKCYKSKSDLLSEITYNSHNQFLSYFLNSGIFGLLLLIFLLTRSVQRAIKNKNFILLTTITFFTFCMLFENILERQSGVILFSFYFSLFNFYNLSKTNKYSFEK